MTPTPIEPPPPLAPDWVDPDPARPVPFWSSLRADVIAHIPIPMRNRSRVGWAGMTAWVALGSAGFHAVLLYRVAHAMRFHLGPVGRVAAACIFWAIRHAYGCSIAPTARLHGGLILPHPQGIVIGAGAVVGPRAWIYQNVTLGGTPGKEGLPKVGADARLYAGAVLAGPIVVGDNVVVGANAVVVDDVPARHLVRCAAAEVVPLPPKFLAGGDGR
jgi:serine O-acetyltransferase